MWIEKFISHRGLNTEFIENTMPAFEAAYNAGVTQWKKPVSCHLYPVRTREYSEFTAVNYHQWGICSDACSLGAELSVPVYVFVKEALIRKFGAAWYEELTLVAATLKATQNTSEGNKN